MAVIKYGSIVTGGSGSLGGSTLQPGHSGNIWRNKPQQTYSRTPAQALIRGYNKTMQAGWRSLSDQDRTVWSNFASSKPVFNRSGEKHAISGHSLWMKYQYTYLSYGLPFLTTPYNYAPYPFGDELIRNGGFDNNDYWILAGDFSIAGGKLNCAANIASNARQSLSISTDDYFKISFDISNCPGIARVVFLRQENWAVLFSSPLNAQLLIPSGHYEYIVKSIDFTIRILIYSPLATDIFSFDNFSMRKAIL